MTLGFAVSVTIFLYLPIPLHPYLLFLSRQQKETGARKRAEGSSPRLCVAVVILVFARIAEGLLQPERR
jgi:hypothetical protein